MVPACVACTPLWSRLGRLCLRHLPQLHRRHRRRPCRPLSLPHRAPHHPLSVAIHLVECQRCAATVFAATISQTVARGCVVPRAAPAVQPAGLAAAPCAIVCPMAVVGFLTLSCAMAEQGACSSLGLVVQVVLTRLQSCTPHTDTDTEQDTMCVQYAVYRV